MRGKIRTTRVRPAYRDRIVSLTSARLVTGRNAPECGEPSFYNIRRCPYARVLNHRFKKNGCIHTSSLSHVKELGLDCERCYIEYYKSQVLRFQL